MRGFLLIGLIAAIVCMASMSYALEPAPLPAKCTVAGCTGQTVQAAEAKAAHPLAHAAGAVTHGALAVGRPVLKAAAAPVKLLCRWHAARAERRLARRCR